MKIKAYMKDYYLLHDVLRAINENNEGNKITLDDLKAEYPDHRFEDFTFEQIHFNKKKPIGNKIVNTLNWNLNYGDHVVVKLISME